MCNFKYISSKNFAHIRTTSQGIEISLPILKKKNPDAIMGLLMGFASWSLIGGIALYRMFLKDSHHMSWSSIIWLCGWLIAEVSVSYILAKHFLSKTVIRIAQMKMFLGTAIWKIRKTHAYQIDKIANLQIVSHDNEQGKIVFNYGEQSIECCYALSLSKATRLVEILTDILTFRCHMVEYIIFGTPQERRYDSQKTLECPDVSDLKFPFVRLKEVIIYATTYEFQQVECFLTYAINYLGRAYLQRQVTVCIYGEENQVHPNLLNNFRHSYKAVYTYHNDHSSFSI